MPRCALRARCRQRGVSLVEALVALLVMSFGILGVVGVQTTLRANADIAKQRSEAVRIAQESIEQWRAYSQLAAGAPGTPSYADIVTSGPDTMTGYTTNTSYTLNRSVVDSQAASTAEPRLRTLVADVSWQDRTGTTQHVTLGTSIAGVSPELAGSLSLPAVGTPTQQSNGRNPVIPVGAVDQGNGTSQFAPPGGSGLSWIFNNTTGVITQVCNPVCTSTSLLLLSGYVRFAPPGPPTPAGAELPLGTPPSGVTVTVNTTLPTTTTVSCYTQAFSTYVAYYCGMPLTTSPPARWSGQSLVGGLTVSSALSDTAVAHVKVCRYTPGRSEDTNLDTFADGDVPLNGNIDHPLTYTNVASALTNQNFLVIQAGDGSTAYDCPGDDTSTPLFNGNTWHHQPHA